MTEEYIQTFYKKVEKKVMGFCGNCNMSIANSDVNVESFVRFIQLCPEKSGKGP